MRLSIVTPAFNEAENLPVLYERVVATMQSLQLEWEWVVIDDHSRDATFAVVTAIAARDPRVRGLRLARNSGAHAALACGLHQARGDGVVALAADLQDPPELIPQLLAPWREGAQVVWAVRRQREGEAALTLGFARLYYWVMRMIVGMREMPATGADSFLLDRAVVDAFARFPEGNTSILALLTWMGFRQASVTYDKQARLHGTSGWTLAKKLKLVVDSVTSFSAAPIRFIAYLGCGLGVLGLAYASSLIVDAIRGVAVAGWSAVIVVMLLLGAIQMVMMGVLGEYLWRALDESRRRPRYLVEATTPEPRLPGGSA
jgi:dolichol-phosphate mannosyltransferase